MAKLASRAHRSDNYRGPKVVRLECDSFGFFDIERFTPPQRVDEQSANSMPEGVELEQTEGNALGEPCQALDTKP